MGTLHRELVWRTDEGQTRELSDLACGRLGKAGCRIYARAHRGAAQCEAIDALQRTFDPLQIIREHARIARPFLPEREWRRVLHMGAADLDDVFPLLGLGRDPVVQCLHSRNQPLLHIDRRRDVHCGGKRVVRRLRHVDMVVRMNRRLAGKRCAGELAAAVGDHLVHIHVELSAAPRHPHMQWEHVLMLAGGYLVTDLNDQLVGLFVEPLAGMVRVGGGFLQNGVCGNHLARDQILADAEVLKGALGLGSP